MSCDRIGEEADFVIFEVLFGICEAVSFGIEEKPSLRWTVPGGFIALGALTWFMWPAAVVAGTAFVFIGGSLLFYNVAHKWGKPLPDKYSRTGTKAQLPRDLEER